MNIVDKLQDFKTDYQNWLKVDGEYMSEKQMFEFFVGQENQVREIVNFDFQRNHTLNLGRKTWTGDEHYTEYNMHDVYRIEYMLYFGDGG